MIGGKTRASSTTPWPKAAACNAQTHCRGVSQVQSFKTRLVFDVLPEWKEVRSRPLEEQRRLLAIPRSARGSSTPPTTATTATHRRRACRSPTTSGDQVLLSPYLPNPTVAQVAAERGVDPVEVIIDLALEHDFELFFCSYFNDQDDEQLLATLRNPNTAMTFSDSGAHVSQIIDSSIQSHLLAYWVRERQALTLEEAVNMITRRPAKIWRLHDRGLSREGFAADITIFDPDTVARTCRVSSTIFRAARAPGAARGLPGDHRQRTGADARRRGDRCARSPANAPTLSAG